MGLQAQPTFVGDQMSTESINNVEYYPLDEVANLWGLKQATIRKYASEKSGKIPGCIRKDGQLLIPANAIRPITKPIAQQLIWAIIQLKNSPHDYLDLTAFGIRNDQLDTVLRELTRQQLVDVDDSIPKVRDRLIASRITAKSLDLVMYKKKMKDNALSSYLTAENISLAFSGVQTLLQLAQMRQK